MIIFNDYGVPLCSQKITPGNAATGFSKYCYEYTRFRLDFDDGDAVLTKGDFIVGADSGAVSKIVEVWPDDTIWTDTTGYIIVDSWNGVAYTNNEELKVAANAIIANVNGVLKQQRPDYSFAGFPAKCAYIQFFAQTELFCNNGGTPDQTRLQGIVRAANSEWWLTNIEQIRNFKVIDYTAGQAGNIIATFFF